MANGLCIQIEQILRGHDHPKITAVLADWPLGAECRSVGASTLPVVRWLPELCACAAEFCADLCAELVRAAPQLAWRQTYSAGESGADFINNYGWTEIIGLNGPTPSDRIACGFLMLGPSTLYPPHRHESEELYIPLSGTAAWQQSSSPWSDRIPGSIIIHAGEEPHAIRTNATPLLALYVWHGAHLAKKARLDVCAR